MSRAIAFRCSDELAQALGDEATKTGQTKTELIVNILHRGLSVPLPTLSPLEVRLLELETQMTEFCARLDAIDLKTPDKLAGQGRIGDKSSPVSSRDVDGVGTSTPHSPALPELTQYIESALKPHSTGGYYFRLEDIGKPELDRQIQQQAKLMGFSSTPIRLEGKQGKSIRVWLNRDYCKQAV